MDKMREEFEAWALSEFGTNLPAKHYDAYRNVKEFSWKVWQASRAALCVELPDNLNGEYYADGWNACLMAVGDKIEEAGVSYK